MADNDALIRQDNHPILLFDGVCNLCVGSVQFVIARDPDARVKFASLQSKSGQSLLRSFDLPIDYRESVVLVENGLARVKSDAILHLMPYLSGAWPLVGMLRIIPRFIRDWVYSFIGNRRYLLFGKRNSCWLATPELKQRFLE